MKVGKHLGDPENLGAIHSMIDAAFKREGDRVLVFVDGDIEFTKVTKNG